MGVVIINAENNLFLIEVLQFIKENTIRGFENLKNEYIQVSLNKLHDIKF